MEKWKAVKDYEGLYEVSDKGRVRSLDRDVFYSNGRNRKLIGRILIPANDMAGYLIVSLVKWKVKKTRTVHRLVAEVFVDNPNNLKVIHHKNSVRTDARACNLEWTTQCDNLLHEHRMQQIRKPVDMFDGDELVRRFDSIKDASAFFGKDPQHGSINQNLSGKSKTAFGYKFKYAST